MYAKRLCQGALAEPRETRNMARVLIRLASPWHFRQLNALNLR